MTSASVGGATTRLPSVIDRCSKQILPPTEMSHTSVRNVEEESFRGRVHTRLILEDGWIRADVAKTGDMVNCS